MNQVVVAGGGEVSGARAQYVSFSKLSANEGSQRLLFSDSEDNLTAKKAYNVLSGGRGKPQDGDVLELIISTKQEVFDKLGNTTDESKKSFAEAVRGGLGKLFGDLKVENVRYVAGIHLNTRNPHAHVLIYKGVQNAETGEPLTLESIPRQWFYRSKFENSRLGEYFANEIGKRAISMPPEMTRTISSDDVFLPAPEFVDSNRSIKAFTSFAERNNVGLNWLERLSEEGTLYVNRQGALTFIKRDKDFKVAGYTNENGWDGKSSEGLFFVGNPHTATKFALVQSPKDAVALLELVGGRDISDTCFISCDGNRVSQEAVDLLREQSLKRSTKIIWSFNLNRDGKQESRSYESFQQAILEIHSPESPSLEFHNYAPRVQYGKTWKDQLFIRNVPGVIAGMMKREFVYKKASQINDEFQDVQTSQFIKDVFERVEIIENGNEFIVFRKASAEHSADAKKIEYGKYRWTLTENGNHFEITSIAGEPANPEITDIIAADESEIIGAIEDAFTVQTELKYIREIEKEAETIRLENEAAKNLPSAVGIDDNSVTETSSERKDKRQVLSREVLRQQAYDKAKAITEKLSSISVYEVLSMLGFSKVNRGETVYEDAAGKFRIFVTDVADGELWNDRKDGMRGNKGGLNLVRHVLDYDFKEAKEWMVSHFGADYVPQPAKIKVRDEEIIEAKKPLVLPVRNDHNLDIVIDYLVNERAISLDLVNDLIERGLLYANSYQSAVFLHRDENLETTGASWRATVGTKRQDVAGSDKNRGWFHLGNLREAKRFVITEAPIEAMSYLELHPNLDLNETVIIAASGNNLTRGLYKQINKQGADGEIILAFNSDTGGETGILNVKEKLGLLVQLRHKKSYIAAGIDEPPYQGKVTIELPTAADWNDVLKDVRFAEKEVNQAEHVPEEINLLREAKKFHDERENQVSETTLETVAGDELSDALNQEPQMPPESPDESEKIHLSGDEIDDLVDNLIPDFSEKNIKVVSIHLPAEMKMLGKIEILFARDPLTAEKVVYPGYRITFNGDKGYEGYTLEKLPSKQDQPIKIGKKSLREGVLEVHRALNEKWRELDVSERTRNMIRWNEHQFFTNALNSVEVYGRKVTGIYEIESSFAVKPYLSEHEKAVINEWREFTKPEEFYAPEEIFVNTYARNVAKRAAVTDLLNRGYLQIKTNGDEYPKIKGGNPLLPEIQNALTPDIAEIKEQVVYQDPVVELIPAEDHEQNVISTIERELKKLNSDYRLDIEREENSEVSKLLIVDAEGEEVFRISSPTDESDGWIIARPSGNFDDESNEYVEVATVEYDFEIADALGEILEIPVVEDDKPVRSEESPEPIVYRNLGSDNVRRHYENDNDHYLTELKGSVEVFTKNFSRDGKNLYLGFKFRAENGVLYQQKFGDTSFDKNDAAIFGAIKDGSIKVGDQIFFSGYVNEQIETKRIAGQGVSAVPVFASRYEITSTPASLILSPDTNVEQATLKPVDERPAVSPIEIIVVRRNRTDVTHKSGERLDNFKKFTDENYPELGISIGYIGNDSLEGDDRQYFVYTKIQTDNSYGKPASFGSFESYDELAEAVFEQGEFDNFLRVIAGARFKQQNSHVSETLDRIYDSEESLTDNFLKSENQLLEATDVIASEEPVAEVEPSETAETNQTEEVKTEDNSFYFEQISPVGDLEAKIAYGRATLEYFTVKGYAITSTPTSFQVWDGSGYAESQDFTDIIDAIAFIGDKHGEFINVRGAYNLRVIPQEHYTFAVYDCAVENVGDYVQTYAQVLEANQTIDFEPPAVAAPVAETKNAIRLEWQPRPIKAEDFYVYGDKRSQGRAMETQVKLAKNSSDLLNALDREFGGELTDEARIKLEGLINAIYNGYGDLGRHIPFSEEVEAAKRFSRQVKGDGTFIVPEVPERNETELERELRIFNELLKENPLTRDYIAEFDEEESEASENLTIGIREANLSIPAFIVLAPDFYDPNYALREVIVTSPTREEPGDITYGKNIVCRFPRDVVGKIIEHFQSLKLEVEAENLIDEDFPTLKDRDLEFEATVRDVKENIAESETIDENILPETVVSQSETVEKPILSSDDNQIKPKIENQPRSLQSNGKVESAVEVPENKNIQTRETGERIVGPLMVEYSLENDSPTGSTALEISSEPIEKIFEVTATESDYDLGKNYRWTEAALHHAGSKKRFQWNMAAIELLRKLEEERRSPETEEEKTTLAKFSGWGSMKGVFNAYIEESKTWEKERQQAASMLNNEEFAAASTATLNSHFTDGKIVDVAWRVASRLGFDGGRVIEPSVGNGIFIGRIPDFLKDRTQFTGIEKDSLTARIAKKLFPESKIREEGYEDHIVPNGWYDLAIGNVPFGDYKVFDKIYNHLNANIHDYFFLKSLDQVRDGGLQILITSSFTMDKSNDKIRDRIGKEGVLVGALRFPNNTFQKNAGTEVVTDLLLIRKKTREERQQDTVNAESYEIAKTKFNLQLKDIEKTETGLRKTKSERRAAELSFKLATLREEMKPIEAAYLKENEAYQASRPDWMKTVAIDDPDGGEKIVINKYFADHPEMVLGAIKRSGSMYSSDNVTVETTDDFDERLEAALELLPENVVLPRTETLDENLLDRIIVDETIRHGTIRVDGGKVLRAEAQSYGGVIFKEDLNVTPAETRRIERLLNIRDASRRIINADLQKNTHQSVDELRSELNYLYDSFVRDFGALHLKKNQELLKGDADLPRLLAIEEYDDKTKESTKTAIFDKPTVRHFEQPQEASDLADALGITLNEYGRLYLPRVMLLLNQDGEKIEQTYLRVQKEFVETGIAFLDPKTDEWTMREEYLAGNVRERLKFADLAAESEPERYKTNVEELTKIIPVDLDYTEIDVELGASWLEKDDVADFLAFLTGGSRTDFVVAHAERSGFWAIEYSSSGYTHRYKPTTTEIWGTGRCNMIEAVQYLCDGRTIVIKDQDTDQYGKTIYVTNVEETEAANQKAVEIQDEFKDWIWQDETRRARLARKYNDLFNSFLPVKYDGSHLTFPGMATEINGKPFELRKNQKDAIWRGIREGKALFGHEVGTGKTYLEIALAMKMKQIGLTNKPLLGFLKKNIKQAVSEARELYPHANILTTDVSFDSKKRKETVSKIATGNYDLVFMTHDHIDMLPMRPESRARHINEQLEELDEVMAVAKHLNKSLDGKSKAEARLHSRLEKAKENLEVRLKEVLGKAKDDAIYFEETGIDFTMIDEFHYYKSLQVFTVKTGIKGIPTNYSERAINMYARFSWLQEKNNGRNTYGATGTPITNTMAELYNQQKYFQRETLEERGIIAFDSWMHNFARTISKMEKTATGEYKTVERLCEFTNLPELVAMSGQFLDIYLASEMPELNRPGLDIEIVKSEMSEDQRAFIYTLQDRAKDLKYGDSDNMLAISTDARKVSLDTRLVMPGASDDPELKVNKLVKIALDNLKLPGIRTQMVFAELGVHGIVFDDIINKLVAGGVPKDKIINFSAMTETEARSAVQRLRNGDALFGFGSTKTLGTGVNAQTNLYAIHNLDTHWLPAYDKQRRGRIERSGNRFYYENENVKSYYYLTTGGFDEIMYAANDRKQKFIDSVMLAKGDPAKVLHRKVRDADTEEITYAEIAAVASGNPLILVQLDLDKEVRSLSNQERRHNTSQMRLKGDLSKLNRHLAEYEREEALYTVDYELWKRETNRIAGVAEANKELNAKAKEEYNDWLDLKKIEVHEGKLTKIELDKLKEPKKEALEKAKLPENSFEVELGGILYHNRAEAGEKLGTMVNDRIFHDTVIGLYKGMKIVAQLEYRSEVRTIGLALQSPGNVKYSVNFWTEEGAFQSMEHLTQKLPEFIQYQKDSKETTAVNLEKIQAEIGKPFKYAERLREAKRELADVEFEISIFSLSDDEKNIKIAERQAKQQQINVTMPPQLVTAEESGYFDKAKETVRNAVGNLTSGLPEGSLAKPALKDVNPEYYREAIRLQKDPLSSFWYKMQYESIGGGKMKVNPATYALIQKAYEQTDNGKTLEFAGLYNDPSMVQNLTKTLREQGKLNVGYKSVLNKFADAIEATSQERGGTISFIADISAAKHEGFHADSYIAAAGKTLEARHTRLDQLVEHEAYQIAQAGLKKEYRNDNCAMHVEELANDIAEALENKTENAETPHNLNREQMESYLDLWFTSFAEANGLVSREKFEELNENAKQIRDVAYDRVINPQTRTTAGEEFQSVEPTLGGISSEEKRRAFFEKLCQAELKRKITDDVVKRQREMTAVKASPPEESLAEQIGEAIILDEQSREIHFKIESLTENRYEKTYNVEHQGVTFTTSLSKLRDEGAAAVENALKSYTDGGFLKADLIGGKKSKYQLEKDFKEKKRAEVKSVQSPIVEQINKSFYAELRPLEAEIEKTDRRLAEMRDKVEDGIAAKVVLKEDTPMPVINPDTLWKLQENAVKRGDLDSFERLERIHQIGGIPRAPRAAGRLAGLAVMAEVSSETEKRDFKIWSEDAAETTRVKLTIKNENEKLVTRSWDADRLREEQKRLESKAEEKQSSASDSRRMAYKRLFDPIKNQVNPLSKLQGSVSWLTDPKGTFNAHFNPIEVIKNDPAVQICRAAFDFVKKQGEAKIIEAQAGELLRGIDPLSKTVQDALDGEIKNQFVLRQAKMENAEKLKEAVKESFEQEKAVRNRLIESGEADTITLGEPKEIFLKDELREVGQASIELGDAKLLKLYEKAVEKPMIADVLGEGTERVAARVVMAHAETAAIAREAVENVVQMEDGVTGAVEISPSKLLDVQKHLEATEVAEAWLNRLAPDKAVEPLFTETEMLRLDTLKYSMDLNSVNAVDRIVSDNSMMAQESSWTQNALTNAKDFAGEIAAQIKPTASIGEMLGAVNQGANLSPLITDAATESLAKNVQLYATGSSEIKPISNAPEYKVMEPTATVNDGKEFWDKARATQDERLGIQKIQNQVFEQEQLSQTLAADAAGAEAAEGAEVLAATIV